MTEQVRDYLNIGEEELSLMSYPDLPEEHPRIRRLSPWDTDLDNSYAHSTACMRGYWATWSITDDTLWLINLRGSVQLAGKEPLMATWLSGTIQASLANKIYSHNGYAYRYQETMVIEIQQGKVINSCLEVTVRNQGRALDSEEWFKLYLFGYETLFPKKEEK